MNESTALHQLLDDLRELVPDTSVVTIADSHVDIFLDASEDPIHINREDAELLLHSRKTVEALFEALDEPADAAIELHHISIEDAVLEILEKLFATVDEV
jgi:hypothetical protein